MGKGQERDERVAKVRKLDGKGTGNDVGKGHGMEGKGTGNSYKKTIGKGREEKLARER